MEVTRPEGLHSRGRSEGSMDEPGLPHARSGAAVSGRDGEVTATYLISLESTPRVVVMSERFARSNAC